MMSPIRVLLVDDNPKITSAWERFLACHSDMTHVGTLTSCDGVVSVALEREPSVVLMDLSMDGMEPLHAVAQLAQRCPSVRVLIYSARTDPETRDAALDAGAWGCVDKLDDLEEVLSVIRRVARL